MEQKKGELDIACRDPGRVEADTKARKLLLETPQDTEREAKERGLCSTVPRPTKALLNPGVQVQVFKKSLKITELANLISLW